MVSRRTVLLGGGVAALAGAGAIYGGFRNMGSMEEFTASVAQSRAALAAAPATRDMIRQATLAANSHNTQPWRFRVRESGIDVLPDLARQLPAVDPDNHHLFASLGCAAENLAIASGARGRSGVLAFNPDNGGEVTFVLGGSSVPEPSLLAAIAQRQSTRGDYDGRSVSAEDLRSLEAASAVAGVDMVLVTDRPPINRIRDLVAAGNATQIADPAFMRELKAWLRFSPRRALQTGDGLFSAASGNPALPEWLGPMLFDLTFKADSDNEKYARQIASSAGIAVFLARKDDPEHWVLAGRACQRFALRATSLGMKHAFLNQPVEVATLRADLASLVGLPGRRPDIVMRFGYGASLPFSARRPVEAVLA